MKITDEMVRAAYDVWLRSPGSTVDAIRATLEVVADKIAAAEREERDALKRDINALHELSEIRFSDLCKITAERDALAAGIRERHDAGAES